MSMKERIAKAISVTGHTEEFAMFCTEAVLTELETLTDEMIEAGAWVLAKYEAEEEGYSYPDLYADHHSVLWSEGFYKAFIAAIKVVKES